MHISTISLVRRHLAESGGPAGRPVVYAYSLWPEDGSSSPGALITDSLEEQGFV